MFSSLGSYIYKHSWWVIAAAVVFITAAATYGTSVFEHLASGGFTSEKFESLQASEAISRNFGGDEQTLIVLFKSPGSLTVTDPAYRQAVDKALAVARSDKRVTNITDYYSTLSAEFVSRDQKSTFAVVRVSGNTDEASNTIKDLRPKVRSDVLSVHTGGVAAINQDFNTQISKDLAKAEKISFTVLAILLIVVFRSFVAALLPLILGAFGVLGAFLVVRILTNVMTISQYAINVIILLGLGLAIDYSLFILSRFREELRTKAVPDALSATMATAGRAVFFSGLTVILSLLGLLIFPIDFLRSMGIGAGAAVAVAMLAALTVLPALMSLLGNRVNALSFGSVRTDYQSIKFGGLTQAQQTSPWYKIARLAMLRPLVTIALIAIPMAFLSQHFLLAKFSSPDYRSLPAGTDSRAVALSLNNDFSSTSRDPIQVIVQTSGPALTVANLSGLHDYVRAISALPGVSRVDSVFSLSPGTPISSYPTVFGGPHAPPALATAAASYVKNNYALIDISYNSNSDQPLARDLVTSVRALRPPPGSTAKVGGTTASLIDLLASLAHYAVYALIFVAAALFVLLFLMLRSLVVPLQALFVNVLSLSATFGVLVWIFQDGHLSKLLGFTSVGSIDATQPVLIFGIAFGLSMDYSVFLLSRIKEQSDVVGHDGLTDSIAQGVQKTGPIITSAAVLFIVVVAAFSTSTIALIKQIGIGLALAIFFDAFLIRILLVPAIMKLFGRLNWWAPRALRPRAEPEAPRLDLDIPQ